MKHIFFGVQLCFFFSLFIFDFILLEKSKIYFQFYELMTEIVAFDIFVKILNGFENATDEIT
jgi:hypothetical protein